MKNNTSKRRWGFWVGAVALVALGMMGPVMADDLTVDNYETYQVTESISFDNEFIGVTNFGTFNQQVAPNTCTNLYLGYGTASIGTYHLDGGSLSATNEYCGYGSKSFGDFYQTGGTNTVTNTLYLNANDANGGYYNLQGGTLSAGTITVNSNGQFIQTGGTVSGTLVNWGMLTFKGGTFNGRLVLYSTPSIDTNNFTAGDGLANYNSLTILAGRTITLNGQGLDNSGTLTLAGGTLDGGGPLVNNAIMSAFGTINGSNGFKNNGSFLQSGNLALNNTGVNVNDGTMALAFGKQFTLNGISLDNRGDLNLNRGTVSGTGTLENREGAVISGQGTISSSFTNRGLLALNYGTTTVDKAFTNFGNIQLTGSAAFLAGGAIDNQGTVEGYGQVANNLSNSGRVEAIGSTLKLTGIVTNNAGGVLTSMSGRLLLAQGLASNDGGISLSGGAFDNNNQPLTNTGQISGYGSFSTGGLSNQNTITLTGGPATVNGPVTNQAGGQVNITANSTFFTGLVTNYGTVKTTSATVTWAGEFINNGAYISDPATQYFTDLTIGANGYIQGGMGDKFSLSGDFLNQSTQNSLWNTTLADLVFTGGGTHQFSVSGTNLAWGTIDITGQILNLVDGDNTPGGAFYVGQLLGLDLNGNLITNITGSPGLTMYYDPTLNSDLNGNYSLANGGTLNPGTVPLPASAWLFLTGLTGLGLLGRRRKGKTG